MKRGCIRAVVFLATALAFLAAALACAPASRATPDAHRPHAQGRLTLRGTFRDGSTVAALGLRWTAVHGSLQSVSYAWSACGL